MTKKPKTAPAKPDVALMTAEEYNAGREALGLSIVGARRTFRFSRRQAQRLSYDQVKVPALVAILMRVMLRHAIKPEDLENYAPPLKGD